MANVFQMQSTDGFSFSVYRVEPAGRSVGTLILLQDVFGRTKQMESDAAFFASKGYDVWVPSLLDRGQKDLRLPYSAPGIARGHTIADSVGYEKPLQDIQACITANRGRVAVLGYAWGGTLAYLAATRLRGLTTAVAYYGSEISRFSEVPAQIPTLMHFASMDRKITSNDVGFIRYHNPLATVFTYNVRHGFASDERGEFYDAHACKTAMNRTVEYLEKHLGAASTPQKTAPAPAASSAKREPVAAEGKAAPRKREPVAAEGKAAPRRRSRSANVRG